MRLLEYSLLVAIGILILFSSGSKATPTQIQPPEFTGVYTGGVELWYMNPKSYRKAGLNIHNEMNDIYMVTGVQMTYNLSEALGYNANVMVQRGKLGEDQDAFTKHRIEGFPYGNETKQNFFFNEYEYLVTDTDFNIQFQSLRSDPIELLYYEKNRTNSFFWDHDNNDWVKSGPNTFSPNLLGREWAMSALVEPVVPLRSSEPQTNSLLSPDAVDAYYTELTLGKTYFFDLENSKSSNFQLYVYRDRDQFGVQGKMTNVTLLASTSGSESKKKITLTAEYSGQHYILVKPSIGTGTYEIKYYENQKPVAKAGDDAYANLELGGSVPVDFESTMSYDPEDNNLMYYWDFDSKTDANGDGNYTNDKDATGQKLTHSFTEGGKFTVTLTVEDSHGAFATDSLDLYLNYIPIVKMSVSYYGDCAYVEQKLTYNAEGSYDPDDDLNGNGIIDGSEVDHLTYSWDFYDAIDKNMDGNRTNDTDASNKMWLMKYPRAGIYTITLNVWDNPEPADRAYNHTQLVLEVREQLPYVELDIDNDIDETREKTNGLDVSDDVLVREMKGYNTTYHLGGYKAINLVHISAENDHDSWEFRLYTQGNIMVLPEKNVEIYYSYYLVRAPYRENAVTKVNIADIEVDYIYNFTFHNDRLTVMDENGEEVSTEDIQVYVFGDMLRINVPLHKLAILIDELKEAEEGEYDFFSVFGMAVFKSTKTVGGETQRIFARDSIGSGTPYGSVAWEVESGFFASTAGDDDDDTGGHLPENTWDWILRIIPGLGLLFIGILVGVLGYSRINKKRNDNSASSTTSHRIPALVIRSY